MVFQLDNGLQEDQLVHCYQKIQNYYDRVKKFKHSFPRYLQIFM